MLSGECLLSADSLKPHDKFVSLQVAGRWSIFKVFMFVAQNMFTSLDCWMSSQCLLRNAKHRIVTSDRPYHGTGLSLLNMSNKLNPLVL